MMRSSRGVHTRRMVPPHQVGRTRGGVKAAKPRGFQRMMVSVIFGVLLSVAIISTTAQAAGSTYTVVWGDSLWKIATANGLSVTQLKEMNNLTSNTIYPGQKLIISSATQYTVQSGDSLWKIAIKYGSSVIAIKNYNGLTSDTIYVNQVLYIPTSSSSPSVAAASVAASGSQAVTSWPSVTYIVKAGDTVSGVAMKFGVSQSQILKYNYMDVDEWLNEGQKLAINGYAPRNYAVTPGESTAPSRTGKLVDWFLDGRYLIKRNDVFLITDVKTGLSFTVKMLGGLNHSDVEPLTAADTAVMKKLFPTWEWTPRPVVIFHDGINFAASLSGMPHSYDTITNNVAGHFDLYLYNSKSHSSASEIYLQQHKDCVLVAAGLK